MNRPLQKNPCFWLMLHSQWPQLVGHGPLVCLTGWTPGLPVDRDRTVSVHGPGPIRDLLLPGRGLRTRRWGSSKAARVRAVHLNSADGAVHRTENWTGKKYLDAFFG